MEKAPIFLNHFFDILWSPLSKTPSYLDILIVSAFSALLFLIIFKKTSNQDMIRHYKNKIIAYILEIRLYKDRPVLTLTNVGKILGYNMVYLRYTLVPLVVIIVPVLIISIQLFNRFGYMPIQKDKSFIVCAELDKNVVRDISKTIEKVQCDTSDGILVETPPMRIISDGSIYWRARVIRSEGNDQFVRVSIEGEPQGVDKEVLTSSTKQGFSPEKRKYNLDGLFVDNAEGFISETSPFKAVTVGYRPATYPFLAWRVDPVVLYFILTLILGFLFKPIVKVNI